MTTHDPQQDYIESLEAQLAQAEKRHEDASIRAYDAENENERLRQQLAQAVKERDHFEYKYHELAKAAGDEQDAMKQELAQCQRGKEAAVTVCDDFKRGFEESRAQIDRLEQDLARLRQELEAYKGGMLHDQLVSQQQLIETLRQRVAELEQALKRIATEHQSYDDPTVDGSSYGIGVIDGHRCAAKIAREVLL
jgi:DNA repair exonuclease SbcCD ATPase subunit